MMPAEFSIVSSVLPYGSHSRFPLDSAKQQVFVLHPKFLHPESKCSKQLTNSAACSPAAFPNANSRRASLIPSIRAVDCPHATSPAAYNPGIRFGLECRYRRHPMWCITGRTGMHSHRIDISVLSAISRTSGNFSLIFSSPR